MKFLAVLFTADEALFTILVGTAVALTQSAGPELRTVAIVAYGPVPGKPVFLATIRVGFDINVSTAIVETTNKVSLAVVIGVAVSLALFAENTRVCFISTEIDVSSSSSSH